LRGLRVPNIAGLRRTHQQLLVDEDIFIQGLKVHDQLAEARKDYKEQLQDEDGTRNELELA